MEESVKQMKWLMKQIGPEKSAALLKIADAFDEIRRRHVTPLLIESGMFSEELMEKRREEDKKEFEEKIEKKLESKFCCPSAGKIIGEIIGYGIFLLFLYVIFPRLSFVTDKYSLWKPIALWTTTFGTLFKILKQIYILF